MRSVRDNPGSNISDAVELRIQVRDSKPPVWRRVIVHPDTDLRELHRLISVLMGWNEGRSHHFEFRGSTLYPEGIENETRQISKFATGAVLVHIIDEKEGPECNVKIVRKDRERTDRLPLCVGGGSLDGTQKGTCDIPVEEIEEKLKAFHRHEELVPDRNGILVEPWRAASLTRPDDLSDLTLIFPRSDKLKATMKSFKPLEPVREKVLPDIPVDLRISLNRMQLPVWRLVRVNSQITFHELHRVIQKSFGWEDHHLYEFNVGESHLESLGEGDVADFSIGTEVINSKLIRLRDVMTGKGWSIRYLYDFGDGWMHTIKVVKVHMGELALNRVDLLDGSGACPPEDCGGPFGYAQLIDILNDPRNREHDALAEVLGFEKWDPQEFDIDAARMRVASLYGDAGVALRRKPVRKRARIRHRRKN